MKERGHDKNTGIKLERLYFHTIIINVKEGIKYGTRILGKP
jgi:hypothetical protein